MNNYKQIRNSIIHLSNVMAGIIFLKKANSCQIGIATIVFKEHETESASTIQVDYPLGFDAKMKKHDNGNFFYPHRKDYVSILLPYNDTLDDILKWVEIINKESGCYPQYTKTNLNIYIGTINAYDNDISNGMYNYYEIRSELADTGVWNGADYEFDVCSVHLYDHAKRMELHVPIALYEKIDVEAQNLLIKHRIGFRATHIEIYLHLNTTMQEITDLCEVFDKIADKDLKYRLLGKKKHFYKTING